MSLKDLQIDTSWSLFLDRDGVINKRIMGGYVTRWNDFEFLPGVLEAIKFFSSVFGHSFIVTNQQGVGKGLMSLEDLKDIHNKLIHEVRRSGGNIDKIYTCTELAEDDPDCRKPKPGMAYMAKEEFPDISFEKSVMVGDNISDMLFGKNLSMKTAFISSEHVSAKDISQYCDMTCSSLDEFARYLKNQ